MLPKIQVQTFQNERVPTMTYSPKNGHNNSIHRLTVNPTSGNTMNVTQNFSNHDYMNQNSSMEGFLQRKESSWDSRHHINAELPKYSAYNDKHSESYKLSMAINNQNNQIGRMRVGHKQQFPNNLQYSHDLNQSAIYQDEMDNTSSIFRKKQAHQRNRSLTNKRIREPIIYINNGSNSTTHNQNKILNVAYNQFGMESLAEEQQFQRDGLKNKKTLQEKVDELYQQLISLYEFNNFSHFHREYFDLFVQDMPSKRLHDILVREIKLINDKKSLYQVTLKTIRARENCLDKLKDAIFSLSDSFEKKDLQIEESCFDNCCRLLAHLRILTISAVESISIVFQILNINVFTQSQTFNIKNLLLDMKIFQEFQNKESQVKVSLVKMRVYMKQNNFIQERQKYRNMLNQNINIIYHSVFQLICIQILGQWRNYFFFIQKYAMGYEKYLKKDIMLIFFWEHMNYMLKIRSDAHFVNHSVMSRYIPFSTKYDPFFVYPNKIKADYAQNTQLSPKIQESINGCLDLSDHLKQRIQNCEKIIISECIMDRANKKLQPISKELLLAQTPKILKHKQSNQNGGSNQEYSVMQVNHPNTASSARHASHEPRGVFEQEYGSASLRADKSAGGARNVSRAGLHRKSMSANKKSSFTQDKYLQYNQNKSANLNHNNTSGIKYNKNFNNESSSLQDIKNQGIDYENSDHYNDVSLNQNLSPNKIQQNSIGQLQNRQASNKNIDYITPFDANIDQNTYNNNVNMPYIKKIISQSINPQTPSTKGMNNRQITQTDYDDNQPIPSQNSQKNIMMYVNSRDPNSQQKIPGTLNPTSQQQKRVPSSGNDQSLKQMAQNQRTKLKNPTGGVAGQKGNQQNKQQITSGRRTASGNQNDIVKMNVQDIGVAISEYIESKLKEPKEKSYYVKPRAIMERELKVTLKDYFLRIPNILYKLLVNDENEFINTLKDEINFHLLEIREQQTERIAALCILHVDRSVITCRRIEIDHFSVIELENFDPILKKLIEYVWNNDTVDEISFRICCNEQPEELNPFQSIQEILFENHFKWREEETKEELNSQNEDSDLKGINSQTQINNQSSQATIKIFYVQRPNSKPKIKIPNLKYVENHVLTVKQSVIISKEPLEMEDHMKKMNLQYIEKPAKYIDITLILISILVQLFTAENLKDLANVKTNKKVKETFAVACQLRAPSLASPRTINDSNKESSQDNVNSSQDKVNLDQNTVNKQNPKEINVNEDPINVNQNNINENDAEVNKTSEKNLKLQKNISSAQISSQRGENNFLLTSGILKTEEFPLVQGLNKYLVGLNQNVFLLKDPPQFKKNKINLGFLQHGFHLPNFHQSTLQTIGDKHSFYLRIRVTDSLEGLCWKLKATTVYGDHELLLIPTEDFNNFMFFLDARDYLAKDNPPDLFLFLRKFFQSVDEKQQMEGDIWIPQFKKKCLLIKNTDVSTIFAEKKIYTNLETSLVFRDQINGGKMILSDLEENAFLVKAPFIFGMLHNELDSLIQNVPFYSFVVDEDDLDFVQDRSLIQKRNNNNAHPQVLSNNPTQTQLKKMGTQETFK